jgi:Helicase HerA, central domain
VDLVIGTAGDRDFSIDAQQLVTGRTCIIAQSGAGKSWAIAVLCERLCSAGIGFVIVDTEGEYFSLREKYPVLWVGNEERCDENIEKVNLKDLMLRAVVNGTAVVFDVSEAEEMRGKVDALAGVLYDIASAHRIPYLLILEEADKFIPQAKESIKKIEEISRRGRKRGLGLLIATQRPSFVTKNVLSQCNNQVIGKLSIENDLRAVDLFFGSRAELEELASLPPGEFFVMGGFVKKKTRMTFATRETEHRGETPDISRARGGPRPKPGPVSPPAPVAQPPRARGPAGPSRAVLPGPAPAITREEAIAIAGKRRRRMAILGPGKNRLVSAELVAWPVARVTVKYRGGLLGRTVRTGFFLLDGVHGDLARVRRGISLRPGFSEVMGLPADAVRVLSRLPLTGATPAEAEVLSSLPREAVTAALAALQERRLVTEAGRAGQTKVFIPLLTKRLPSVTSLSGECDLALGQGSGQAVGVRVTEGQAREVLKGIEPTAEVVSFDLFTYPLWEIVFSDGGPERRIYLDAITGKEVPGARPA